MSPPGLPGAAIGPHAVSRRDVLAGLGSIIVRPSAATAAAPPSSSQISISDLARGFVAKESPESVWPFRRQALFPVELRKKVFFHYLVTYPLSIDNKPPANDYYSLQYLQRQGESDKFRKVGGFLRERPRTPEPWSRSDWRELNLAIEVRRAQLIGGDGFGVDLMQLGSGPYWDETQRLYKAAAELGSTFKILVEPDMQVLQGASPDRLVTALASLARNPSSFQTDKGEFLIAPFFPERWSPSSWEAIIKELRSQGVNAALMPILLNHPDQIAAFAPMSYGMSEWGERSSADLTDARHKDGAERKSYAGALKWMDTVAPQDARPYASIFWEAGNTRLFRSCWQNAIRDNAPFVHVVTWNDYAEETEISPSSAIHFLFYDLCCYFICWWKSGAEPAITKDAIYFSHRRDIIQLEAPAPQGDIPLRLLGRQGVRNEVEAVTMLRSPGTFEVELAGRLWRFDAPAGLGIFSIPATPGRPVFRLRRSGTTVLTLTSWAEIVSRPDVEDALYVGGSTTRSASNR